MRDRFGIFGTVTRFRELSLLLVMMLRIPNTAKFRFIPPKAAPKHALNALETPPKCRKTIVDIDEDVRRLDRIIIELQSSVNSITRQLSNQNTIILGLSHDLASANKKIRELERR